MKRKSKNTPIRQSTTGDVIYTGYIYYLDDDGKPLIEKGNFIFLKHSMRRMELTKEIFEHAKAFGIANPDKNIGWDVVSAVYGKLHLHARGYVRHGVPWCLFRKEVRLLNATEMAFPREERKEERKEEKEESNTKKKEEESKEKIYY